MKKIKGLALGAGTLATVIAPLAAAVSCGMEKPHVGGSGAGGELVIGIRTEDYDHWKQVGDVFGKATDAKITFKQISSGLEGTYEKWHMSKTMPDIMITGSGMRNEGSANGWFHNFNMNDLFTNPKYTEINSKISDPSFRMDPTMRMDAAHFDKNATDLMMAPGSHTKYMGAPVIKGMATYFAWQQYADGTDIYLNDRDAQGHEVASIHDNAPEIKWYVPKGNGELAEVPFGNTRADSPLIRPDGKHYRLTKHDVQEFIFGAAYESQRKFNLGGAATFDDGINALDFTNQAQAIYGNDPKKAVISTGPSGLTQRLFAVQKAIYDHEQTLRQHSFLPPNTFRQNDVVLGGDAFSYYSSFFKDDAAHKNPFIDSNGQMIDAQSNQHAWHKQIPYGQSGAYNRTTISKAMKLMYLSAGLSTTSSEVKAAPEFADKQMPMVQASKWRTPYFVDQADRRHKKFHDGKITAFATPFSPIGVDGYSISRELEDKGKESKLELALKLMRFIEQPKVLALLSHNKAVPVSEKAIDVMTSIYPGYGDFVDEAFAITGQPSTANKTLPANETALTGCPFLSAINSKLGYWSKYSGSFADFAYDVPTAGKYFTVDNILKKTNSMSRKFWTEIAAIE